MSILPVPKDLYPNPPYWHVIERDGVAGATTGVQERLDEQYLHGVVMLNGYEDGIGRPSIAMYNERAAAFVEDQTRKRAASADPSKYVMEKFTYPEPRRLVYDYSPERGSYARSEPVDYGLVKPPQMAAYVPPKESKGIVPPGPDPEKEAMWKVLVAIAQKVGAFDAKLDKLLAGK